LWQARPNEVDITVSSSRWSKRNIASNYDTLLYKKEKPMIISSLSARHNVVLYFYTSDGQLIVERMRQFYVIT
jgi:hypothetical protein